MISLYHLHIEPTTQCNARCPQCPRTDVKLGDTRTDLPIVEWDVDQLRDVLSASPFSRVNDILISGNHGDIVMHSSPLEFARVCREKADRVQINTNGSGLKPSFWSDLAKMGVIVEFSIEGMSQKTHEIYRRNTLLDRILENAKAFIDAGGHAKWAMTVFRHNQHEVDDCEEFANYLGFKEFNTRQDTSRFENGKTDYFWRGEKHTLYAPEMVGAVEQPCHIRRGMYQTSLFLSADQRIFACCFAAELFNPFSGHKIDLNDMEYLDSQIQMIYDEYIRTQWQTPKRICQTQCGIGKEDALR